MKFQILFLILYIFYGQVFGQNKSFRLPKCVSFQMIYVEGGDFTMGCTEDHSTYSGVMDCETSESPAHDVILSSFYIGKFEVTQELWDAVMGTTIYQQADKSYYSGVYGAGDAYPMYYINYIECEEFCRRLNDLLSDQIPDGFKFSLPTEAQWEYAARGGKEGKPTLYSGSNDFRSVAVAVVRFGWHKYSEYSADEEPEAANVVGTKDANELGIYDMSGNVWEWCLDWFNESYYSSSPKKNPKNMAADGSRRVLRGGSWCYYGQISSVAYRCSSPPTYRSYSIGFRLALVK